MASASPFDPRLGLVITDERQIGRGRADDGVGLVTLRTTMLDMPRAAGARRSADRIGAAHPGAQRGVYAWHYLTHASDDALTGRGTRTLDAGTEPVGHLREGGVLDQAWTTTMTALSALEGSFVVLRTPPSFSPGTLSRRRLANFVARVRDGAKLVWEPEGMWSPEETVAVAGELDINVMLPAFSSAGRAAEYDAPWSSVWRRVGGMGARPELSSAAAEVLAFELADAWEADPAADPVIVMFEGERAHANLRRFRRALTLL